MFPTQVIERVLKVKLKKNVNFFNFTVIINDNFIVNPKQFA